VKRIGAKEVFWQMLRFDFERDASVHAAGTGISAIFLYLHATLPDDDI
jgi:hypothetical protein